jgi:hypothetical protein
MAFGLSTENARKWSRKGKSLHPEGLGTLEKSQKKGEYIAKAEGRNCRSCRLVSWARGVLPGFGGEARPDSRLGLAPKVRERMS